MTTREATPTEYRGVRYRSKCEAMFAMHLWLELEEESSIDQFRSRYDGERSTVVGGGGFQYEPKTLVSGCSPDFLVWRVSQPASPRFPVLQVEYIEYKPSRPTETYIQRFLDGMNRLRDLASEEFFARIVYGSPYTQNRESGLGEIIYSRGLVEHVVDDWGANTYEEILAYRFDLEAVDSGW